MASRFLIVWPYLLVLLLGLVAAWPITEPGLFASHDGPIHVMRQAVWHQTLNEGQLPPRWVGNLLYGYGYPLFIFLYPLPLVIGEVFVRLGLPITTATESVYFLATLAGSLGMYLWAKKLWGNIGGVLASATYTLFPYHAVELYVRGSIGEVVALGLFPWLMWSIESFVATKNIYMWFIAVLLGAGLILSHNILAMLLFPLAGIVIFIRAWECRHLWLKLGSILPLGVGLTAWFWLPALWESKWTILNQAIAANFNFRDHVVAPLQLLLYSPWGYGGSKPGLIDGMSFVIPKEFLALFLIASSLLIWHNFSKKSLSQGVFWIIVTVLAAFFTLEWSLPVWELVKPLGLVQYPWRFMAIVMIGLSIVIGYLGNIWSRRCQIILVLAIVLILVIRNVGYFKTGPESGIDGRKLIASEALVSTTTTYADEHLPIWIKEKPLVTPPRKIEILKGKGIIELQEQKGHKFKAALNLEQDSALRIHTFYYPGWQVWVDSKKSEIKISEPYGAMDVYVPSGSRELVAIFTDTQVRQIGAFVTVFAVILTGIFLWRIRRV